MNRFLYLTVLVISSLCQAFTVYAADSKYEPTPANPNFHSVQRDDVTAALDKIKPSPRLLLTDEAIAGVREKIQADPRWAGYYEALKKIADEKLNVAPVEYKLEGVRLLQVSREALKRVFNWSFLYRFTGDEKYAKRVEKEIVVISDFSDWHPAHFLDVAEMTVAVAIGYDSCKECFSEETKTKVREAIRDKGVLEVRNIKGWWKRNTANWNQVCWCGNLFGALAIYSDVSAQEREIMIDAIVDSLRGVTWSMSSYQPDGNYTEGPGYWGYGTGFNMLLFGALESSLGNDFGLSDDPGFLKSINYYEHVFGTTGNAFNYPDSGGGKMFEATAFWYSKKLADPSIVWNENQILTSAYLLSEGKLKNPKGVPSLSWIAGDRVAVCALLWGAALDKESVKLLEKGEFVNTAPKELGYFGVGNNLCCVALLRTAWKQEAGYLGIKCGQPNAPHGHLDAGSFVYDDQGVRWLIELGPESYNKIESLGMNLWNMNQNSDRWKLLRYNNFGHSVPTINGNLQLAEKRSSFIAVKIGKENEDSEALIDLTPVYQNDAAKVTRKTILKANGDLVVEDTFEALANKEANIERRFLTPAQVQLEAGVAVFTLPSPYDKGVKLQKRVLTQSDKTTSFSVQPCSTDKDYDAPNPGVSILIESSKLAPGEKAVFTTTFSSDPN